MDAAGRGLATPLICPTRTCPILYRKNNIFNLCFQLFIKLTCAIDINSFYSAVTSYKLDNNFKLPSQLTRDTWQQQGRGPDIELTLRCIMSWRNEMYVLLVWHICFYIFIFKHIFLVYYSTTFRILYLLMSHLSSSIRRDSMERFIFFVFSGIFKKEVIKIK